MMVEYKSSVFGEGHELHISSAEYRRVNCEAGWSDRSSLKFAVDSYLCINRCINRIYMRELKEASRHIKKNGTIVLVTKSNGEDTWCEVYAITEGSVIPVITGIDKLINYSNKTKQEIKQLDKCNEGERNE